MTVSTFVRADRLSLATLFQSRDEWRPEINGVFIHHAPHGACLVATNGRQIAIFKDEEGYTGANLITKLPREAISAINRSKNMESIWFGIMGSHECAGRREARIFDMNLGKCENHKDARDAMEDSIHPGVIWTGAIEIIDGVFPQYEWAVPKYRNNLTPASPFNPKLLDAFTRVARAGKSQFSIILFQGYELEPILVDCGRKDFVGALMPFRAEPTFDKDEGKIVTPDWALCGVVSNQGS